MNADALSGGFATPVFDAQAVFRIVLDVLSRPGRVAALSPVVAPPSPLNATAGAVLAALADQDTPVFLDAALQASDAVATWIGFHTGAPIVADPGQAVFAVIADPQGMPPLSAFGQGSDDYPDCSTTVILQVEDFEGVTPWRLAGPGIDGSADFAPGPVPADMIEQLAANRARFPRGVDLIFAAPGSLAALPRSTRVTSGGG
ncbi:MAG: phosphonate C-P lyase system protein PhnH [Bauldia sp.]|nr:phosphonate C-P lyase system protein PhnH [Bauldia sp.]